MSQALESLREKIQVELADIRKSVGSPTSNKISIAGKQFRLPDGTTHQGPLYAVILDHRNLNRYYNAPYDPQSNALPECFALSKGFADLSPQHHQNVPAPQAAACSTCALNAFGSAQTGKGKACRNMVRLAVAASKTTIDTPPMTLEIPPSALKSWNRHVNDLESLGMLPIHVVTEIGFDTAVPYPRPTFKAGSAHDELETFWALREKAQGALDQPPA